MEIIEFTTTQDLVGRRVDVILSDMMGITRSSLTKRIFERNIKVNGFNKSYSWKVRKDDIVVAEIEELKPQDIKPERMDLDILFEDDYLVAINKPPSMVVHPGCGVHSGTLVNGLLYHYKDKVLPGGEVRPGIIHRLDKDTSGVILVAKDEKNLAKMQKKFQNREIEKEYRTIVLDNITEDEGTVDSPIGRHPKIRQKMTIDGVNSKESISYFKIVERFGFYTYLSVFPKTGRTHQIRVHMSSIQHPILGDAIYGVRGLRTNKLKIVKRQLLHAYRLSFEHPVTNESIDIMAAIPKDFEQALDDLRQFYHI